MIKQATLLSFLFCLLSVCANAQELKLFKENLEPATPELAKYIKSVCDDNNLFENQIELLREKATSQDATTEDKQNLAAFLLKKVSLKRKEPYENLDPLFVETSNLVNENVILETIWGDIFFLNKDYENALFHYETALNKKANDIDLIGKYGLSKANLQHYESAIDYILQFLEKYPTDSMMLFVAGRCFFETKQYEEAIDYYTKAKENSNDPSFIKTVDELIRQAKEFLASTDDSETDEDQRFIITFAGNSKEDLGDITFDILDEIYYDVTNLIGVNPEVKINIIFFLTEDYYKQGQSWSAGGAQGLQILIPLKSGYKSEEYVKGLLAHEFTHTMINLKTNNRAPLWLHEGLAQYQEYAVTNGSADVIRSDFQSCLQNDFIDGELSIPLDKIPAYINSKDNRDVVRGYVASYMAVRCIADYYGEHNLQNILGAIGQGKSVSEAIEEAIGKDYSDFQEEIKDYIKNQ